MARKDSHGAGTGTCESAGAQGTKQKAVNLLYSEAEFIVPDWGDKVNSGIGLSYRPARLHRLAGRYGTAVMPIPIWDF